jgi:hypothetical protein
MMRFVFIGLAAALLTLLACVDRVEAARNKAGGIITCTVDNCMKACTSKGTDPGKCGKYCYRVINDRKASGDCK